MSAIVKINRPDQEKDEVMLNFNKAAFQMLSGLPLMIEENHQGILLTVPEVDCPGARKVTWRSRYNFEATFIEEFEDGYFEMEEIDKETFLIRIEHED